MNKELIIKNSPDETTIAILNDKQLIELHREKGNNNYQVGDIYLGKVKKVMAGLNAAFIDVGYEKDAFLHYLDLGPQAESFFKYTKSVRDGKQNSSNLMYFKPEGDIKKDGKITDAVQSGQYIMVQIAKEPISAKGPRVTTEISLAGRYIVLIPFADKVSVSSKITSSAEKSRLKELMNKIKPKNFGVIIRTVAEGKTVLELESDLNELMKKWNETFSSLKTAEPPLRLLGELDRTNTIMRDLLNNSFNAIHVDDAAMATEMKAYIKNIAPDKEEIVKAYNGRLPIFDNFNVEKQIKSLFGKTVHMKTGAYLIIEHTEAMHVIDVNSGNRAKSDNTQEANALEVNLEAAAEVARQLRLRDMGGIIVVDFIDLHSQENKALLYNRLKELMSTDRAKHNILPPSKFGLIQITRQRVRTEMNVEVLEPCPSCGGNGKIQPSILFADQLEHTLRFVIRDQNIKGITLHVHPYLEAYLKKGLFSKQYQWWRKYKQWVKIKSLSSFGFLEYKFYDKMDEEIIV